MLPIHITDAEEAFEYWAGFTPPEDFEMMEGAYFRSPHFTYEFEVYLKMRPTNEWWNKLTEEHRLAADYQDWTIPQEAPNWFKPTETMVMYSRHDPFDQSRFFMDTVTQEVYLYEVQY